MKVNGKTIVVTGAGGGVGRALVLDLVQKGANVAAVDINKERLEETLKAANSDKVSIHICDITDQAAVEAIAKEIIEKHKEVDGLINNAGIIQPFINVNDLSYSKINLVMNVNFYGTLYMVKSFMPHLLERPVAHIVNVSSMGGFFPVPGQSIYGASKAAVKLMTEGLYAETVNTNVGVSIVFPGAIETNISKNSGVEMKEPDPEQTSSIKMLSPEKAASIIINAMEKNKFQVYAGSDSKFMHFLYKLSPKLAVKMITKMLKGHVPE